MTVSPGTRLGPYEIVAPIGAGGMGEVWRARDTRLERSVAIKVLPSQFASSPELRLRLEREAKSISRLNHPHICTLFDVGNQDGIDYLVMELLEGESLADRLDRGALPLESVLRYGIEIAEALDLAHRSGIAHRDLKPGNIMITKGGAKLLDFGLARPAPITVDTEVTQQKPLTAEGTIVGTFQYMAPEQLEGGDADYRADLFALGCVLYEMATGRHAFEGKTRTSLIAAIVAGEPKPISETQPLTPRSLERLIAACLRKDPDARWQSAHDIRLGLESIRDSMGIVESVRGRSRSRAGTAIAALVAAGVIALAFFAGRAIAPRHREEPLHAGFVSPPNVDVSDFALSPDGRMLAFTEWDRGVKFAAALESVAVRQRVWIADLTTGAMRPAGEGESAHPFWSADGHSLGFERGKKLWRVAANGGATEPICELRSIGGATWNAGGVIVLAGEDGLYRVNAGGGEPVLFLKLSGKAGGYIWPSFLPDGKHFLFVADADREQDVMLMVGSLDPNEKPRPLRNTLSNATYVEPGYLLYVTSLTLVAQRFDAKTFQLSGDPVPIGSGISDLDFHHYDFTVVGDRLVYGTSDPRSRIHVRDRQGNESAVAGEVADWVEIALAPDGRRALLERLDEQRRAGRLWLWDIATGGFSQLPSSGGGREMGATWSPSGDRFVCSVEEGSNGGMVERRLDSVGARQVVHDWMYPTSWAGDWIATETWDPISRADVTLFQVSTGKRVSVAATQQWENGAQISPDGKWVAYNGGDNGIDVQPIPPTGERWRAAPASQDPRWRGDSRALYVISRGMMMEVPVHADGAKFTAGTPEPLFRLAPKPFKNRWGWAVSPDGQKFYVNELEERTAPTHVVANWQATLPRQ